MNTFLASPNLPWILIAMALIIMVVIPLFAIIRRETKKGRRLSIVPSRRRSMVLMPIVERPRAD